MTPARKRWDFFSRRHPQYYGQITAAGREDVMTARALDLVVAGGRVVTSVEVLDTAVGIRDGRIVALAPVEDLPPAERTIDATGKIVFPGAIDCHVHLGPEYDDWRGGPLAAAQAGLGTILSFVVADEADRETLPQGHPSPARGDQRAVRSSTSASTSSSATSRGFWKASRRRSGSASARSSCS